MNKDRRNWMAGLGALGLTGLFATDGEAAQREAKPLTTAGLAKSLLGLAEKAEQQGMREEAQAIYAAVKVVLRETPTTKQEGGRK